MDKISTGPGHRMTLGYLPFSLRRRFGRVDVPGVVPEVWVVSPGGVGTTALMKHIARFRRVNASDDSDQLKHLPQPPRLPQGVDVRFLFISGDEADIFRSLGRRGWLEDQAANLGAPLAVVLRGRMQRWALARAVRRQKRAWTEGAPPRTLHLDYAEVFEAGPRLAAFLDIADPAFLRDYPERMTRT